MAIKEKVATNQKSKDIANAMKDTQSNDILMRFSY